MSPYVADPATLHLWHLDELSTPSTDAGQDGTELTALSGGAVLGADSFAGFGTALNTVDGGQDGILPTSKNAVLSALPLAEDDTDSVLMAFADPDSGAFTFEAIVRVDFDPSLDMAANGRNSPMQILSGDGDFNAERVFQWRLAPVGFGSGNTSVCRFEFINIRQGTGIQTIVVPIPDSGPDAIASNKWYHVAVTYDGNEGAPNNLKFYWTLLDTNRSVANLIGTGTMFNDLVAGAACDFAIGNEGRATGGSSDNFIGLIDEVRISSVARAPNEFVFRSVSVLEASSWQEPNVPANTLDGDLGTRWSAQGDGQWITYDLGRSERVESIDIAFYQGNIRTATFDVLLSNDNANWVTALANAVSHSVNGKAWVNQILENNPVPTIWVTNRIEQIDPAFRRRFAYHLELKSPPPGAREQLIRKTLEGVSVSDAFVAKLTERKGLTPAQIRTAVRFADLAHAEPVAGGEAFEALIERQLKNSDAALGRKPDDAQAKKGRRKVTTYDLDMLNVESRFEIPRIVEALKARGHGALCFYGAPGTGKTALGEYIAEHLGQPLIIKQASDLVSKYVGETEQNMAAMFKEATEEKAVLLLDEADSFLMDRRGAHRTYEVTEVNEMLQQMERHHGVFICTTNLLDRIDQAALRRFTFKIKFMPLKPEQREQMFITEALGGKADLMTPDVRRRLSKLEQLAPGDFAAVKRQTDILAAEFSVEEFLEQLEAEHRIKPEVREQRGIGFVH